MCALLSRSLRSTFLHARRPAVALIAPRRAPVTCRAMATAAADGPPSAEELRGQSCSLLGGCSSDTPSIPIEQLPQYLTALPAWSLAADNKSISRKFVAKNFVQAVAFFNQIVTVAEAEGHHPDLHLTRYREVEVVLSTHAIGDLSILDMVMAAKIDALPVQYSPKWERENAAKLGKAPQQQQQPAAATSSH